MIGSFAKMRFHCRVLIEEYFPLPSSDDIVTSPQNVKMYSIMRGIAFQSERCKTAVHSRVLKSSRVKYSKNSKNPGLSNISLYSTFCFLLVKSYSEPAWKPASIYICHLWVKESVIILHGLKEAQSQILWAFDLALFKTHLWTTFLPYSVWKENYHMTEHFSSVSVL